MVCVYTMFIINAFVFQQSEEVVITGTWCSQTHDNSFRTTKNVKVWMSRCFQRVLLSSSFKMQSMGLEKESTSLSPHCYHLLAEEWEVYNLLDTPVPLSIKCRYKIHSPISLTEWTGVSNEVTHMKHSSALVSNVSCCY